MRHDEGVAGGAASRFCGGLCLPSAVWVVPIAFVLAFVREEVASSKLKRGVDIAVTVLCMLVIAVWIVRLINPVDAGLLFGGHAPAGVPDDIIHLEPPRWLTILRSFLS